MNKEIHCIPLSYCDFGEGKSGNGIFIRDFMHGDTKMVTDCFLVDNVFVVVVGENGKQLIVPVTEVMCFTTLHNIDFTKGEHYLPLKEQEQIGKARKLKAG